MNEIKKSFDILGVYKYRLPFMLFLFMSVSLIDVMGIGLIGPFVALLGHSGEITDDYPFFFNWFGFRDNNTIVLFVGLSLAFLFSIKGIIAFYVQRKILSLGYEIRTNIIDKLIKSYQSTSYEEIAVKDVSRMIVNAKTHVGLFTDSVFVPALRMTIELIVALGIFLLMAYTSFILVLLVSLLLSLVLLVYFKFIKARLYYHGQIMSDKEASVINEIGYVIGAFREIRLLGVEKFFRNEIKKDVIKFGEAGVITRSLHLISRYVIEASLVIFIVSIVIYMIYQSQPIEQIFSILSIFAVGALRLVPSFNAIGLGFANIRTATYALDSLHEELSLIDIEHKHAIDKEIIPIESFAKLELRDVSYHYKTQEVTPVLKNISLEIEKGDLVAISGKSGSGKSTLMDIMIGMLIPSKGQLIVNGMSINVANISDMRAWQNKCAFIPQSVFLINDSIKQNIALGVEEGLIDNKKLETAIEGANLTEVLDKNDMKLESNVGEGGIKLSGGQRQRVALARALYSGREVIFMDEATSALDKETEDLIMNHIESLRGRVTIILITHSPSALKNCNKVFKLQSGVLI